MVERKIIAVQLKQFNYDTEIFHFVVVNTYLS